MIKDSRTPNYFVNWIIFYVVMEIKTRRKKKRQKHIVGAYGSSTFRKDRLGSEPLSCTELCHGPHGPTARHLLLVRPVAIFLILRVK